MLEKLAVTPSEARALRACFREPVPEVYQAAAFLDVAACAHVRGDRVVAAEYIAKANIAAVREWTESLWGSHCAFRNVVPAMDTVAPVIEGNQRMPNTAGRKAIRERDGFHCRFCGVPLIRPEVRAHLAKEYPQALPWGPRNREQHAAFQAMWLQYDHVLPHSRGGTSGPENVVLTCAPCNFCRMEFTLEEVGIGDPFLRPVLRSSWDGLERVIGP